MKKNRIIAALAVLVTVIAVFMGVALSNNSASAAAPCTPSDDTTQVIHHDAVTHVVHHDAVTHVVHHEAVTHVVHHDAVTHVVHHEAVPAGPDLWWNWSPNNTQGPQDYEPAFPVDERGTWQGPHENGGPDQDTYGTFNASNENSGNSSWFHREHGTPAVDAYDEVVVDQEAYDETVVDTEAYDETVVDHEAYDETVVDHEAYDETVVIQGTDCPNTPDTPDEPNTPEQPAEPATPVKQAPPVVNAPSVPTAVDGGL